MSLRTKVLFEDTDKIKSIIDKCEVCYVGMADGNNEPYVVPYNFGFHNGMLFLHSAQQGKKMDILRKNNKVWIVFSTDHQMAFQHQDVACSYLMRYRSVMISGRVEFLESNEEKAEALNIIMKKYTGRDFKYGIPSLVEVCCYKVIVEKMSGKEFGY